MTSLRLLALFASAFIATAPVAAQQAAPQPGAQAQRPTTPTARERQARPQPAQQQQQRRRQAGDQPTVGQRQATPAQPPRGGGGLNLDLTRQSPTAARPGGTQRAGDAFAASGPYATDAQMQRFTGRRQMPQVRAPISVFGDQQQSGPVWAAPR